MAGRHVGGSSGRQVSITKVYMDKCDSGWWAYGIGIDRQVGGTAGEHNKGVYGQM